MLAWHCFSTADFLSIGQMRSWLHFLPLLSGFCSVGYLLVIAAMRHYRMSRVNREIASSTMRSVWANMMSALTRWKKDPNESARDTIEQLKEVTKAGSSRHGGRSVYWPIWFMAIIGVGIVYAYTRIPNYPTVELHNVRVEKQVAPDKWLMSEAAQGQFLYTACHDFPTKGIIEAGYIARVIRYEDHGNCKSIQRADLGVWWERDSDGNAKEIR